MAIIKEFNGVRPPAELVEKVAELPYDVFDTEEAREIAGDNKCSFFHISKPEIGLSTDINPYDESVYQKGADNLQEFLDNKYLVKDEEKSLYLYTLIMNGKSQTGLVTCVSIDDYLNDVVKKHEYTREDKEQDRIKHLDSLNAQTGLVFLLYKNENSIYDLFEKALEIEPEYDFTATDGVRHIFRRISDKELISSFKESFKGVDLYIADGHHRAASAVKNGVARREKNSAHSGDEDYNSFLTVVFPHDQLHILAYNRVVKDLNGLSEEEFIKTVSEKFEIEKVTSQVPENKRTFCMYLNKEWYLLKPKFEISTDPVKSLDVSVLQEELLNPILGIDNPRTNKRVNFIGGIRGTKELIKLVDTGKYEVAFSMYPTAIEDLIKVSDAGTVMPPKSTWFEPKLRSGIIIHQI